MVNEEQVKNANRKFYDAVADRYEAVDGRRSPELAKWLENKLRVIRKIANGERLLDIGTGSGFVTRCAQGIFRVRIGIDLSPKLLTASQSAFDAGIAADVGALPFSDKSFDAVTGFAVLHHLYSFEELVSEIRRILKPKGVLYTDHDMDAAFRKRFRLPIWVYRKLNRAEAKFRKENSRVSRELYRLTEWKQNGIDTPYFVSLLRKAGFSVEFGFHWFGLSPLLNLFPARIKSLQNPGRAPLVSITATRK